MKTLFLTHEQAKALGSELSDYTEMMGPNCNEMFEGFKITFGDLMAEGLQNDRLELLPLANYVEFDFEDEAK